MHMATREKEGCANDNPLYTAGNASPTRPQGPGGKQPRQVGEAV